MASTAKALSVALLIGSAAAQTAGDTDAPVPEIRVSTKMVLVDVVASDKNGPVQSLERDDFIIEENGKPQAISGFTAQRDLTKHKSKATTLQPRLADNVFSNRPVESEADGPLVILLLDGLNTTFNDQAYARKELLRYVDSQLQSGQRLAVFALTNRLIKLQDFTADATVLRTAIAQFAPAQLAETSKSTSLSISTTANANFTTGSTDAMILFQTRTSMGNAAKPSVESALANLQAFDAARAAVGLEARIATTLEAFRALARSVAAYRGRKNLVWVSSAFPFTLVPDNSSLSPNLDHGADPTAPPPLPNQMEMGVMQQDMQKRHTDEIRRVAAMMGDVQISIYPVDARGLVPATNVNDASDTNLTANGRILFGRDYSHELFTRGSASFSSQQNMKDLAGQTGGRAFVNRNDIDHAVALAAAEGRVSYTLAYYPSNKHWNGAFRKIKVRVRRPGIEVRHRTGYFAFDPERPKNGKLSSNESLAAALQSLGLSATMVLFDVEVRPKSEGVVEINFLVDPKTVTTTPADGKQKLSLEFYVVAYDRNGKVGANTGKSVDVVLNNSEYQVMMQKGLMLPLDIQVPAGDYRFRLAVQDTLTGFVGSVDALATVN